MHGFNLLNQKNICSSDNATLDRTHKTLHNIPERYVFGKKHAGPDTDQDALHGKFHQHSRMRNRGNRAVNSTRNPFLWHRHESPNPARVAKRRGRDLVTSDGKCIPHEKQYHVHFLARYDISITSDWIQTFSNVIRL